MVWQQKLTFWQSVGLYVEGVAEAHGLAAHQAVDGVDDVCLGEAGHTLQYRLKHAENTHQHALQYRLKYAQNVQNYKINIGLALLEYFQNYFPAL